MGYSESSLRRLVDKIQDGSSNSVEYVVNPSMLGSSISGRREQSPEDNNMVDGNDESMFIEDDNSDSPESPSLEMATPTEAVHAEMDQLGDGSDQPHLPDCGSNNVPTDQADFSLQEICTYQLIAFLDEAKAPRNCYDRLVSLLKRQQKMGFSISGAIGRDTFLKSLKKNSKVLPSTV